VAVEKGDSLEAGDLIVAIDQAEDPLALPSSAPAAAPAKQAAI
jgi:hypothetical protein